MLDFRSLALDTEIEDSPVSFSEWLAGRSAPLLSTNAGAAIAPFQSWRNFKEAFAPELIGRAVEETERAFGRPVRQCIDPFGGSGTTALACQFLGVNATTIEVNPYLADLIEAKLDTYDVNQLVADYRALLKSRRRANPNDLFPGAPETFVEPGTKDQFVFSHEVAQQIANLRARIESISNRRSRRLFRVLLGSIALEVSNVVISGKGRRYRKNWQARYVDPRAVRDHFDEALIRAIYEIRRYQNRPEQRYRLLRGDARKLIPAEGDYDLAIFSPPYPNSFDYTDVYNVELWVCGYLHSSKDNVALRLSTLRSHVQIKRSFETEALGSLTLASVMRDLQSVRASLWNKNIPDMVQAYFGDMNEIFMRLSRVMKAEARAYVVVGDSRYQGVQVPVGQILSELGASSGFSIEAEEPFRSMRASPQQGGKAELVETLLTFKRL